MKMIIGFVAKQVDNYWRAGVVSGLLIVDGLALIICIIDIARFANTGALTGALRVSWENGIEGEGIGLAIAVLMFFIIALPMLVLLVSSLIGRRERWPRIVGGESRAILVSHVLVSIVLAGFTIIALSMEVLSGYENDDSARYSFVSTWLAIVLLGKPLWASYISPIIRKFFIRIAPHENPNIREVAKEVLTEESMGPERAA